MPPNPNRRRCTATTKAGAPCRAWAVRAPSPDGPDRPLCATHAKLTKGAGAPRGNQNRRTHGAYTALDHDPPDLADLDLENCTPPEITGIVEDLTKQYMRLSRLIDHCLTNLNSHTLTDAIKLMALHAQTASRLGRLLQLLPPEVEPTVPIEEMDAADALYVQIQAAARLMELGELPDILDQAEEFYERTHDRTDQAGDDSGKES